MHYAGTAISQATPRPAQVPGGPCSETAGEHRISPATPDSEVGRPGRLVEARQQRGQSHRSLDVDSQGDLTRPSLAAGLTEG